MLKTNNKNNNNNGNNNNNLTLTIKTHKSCISLKIAAFKIKLHAFNEHAN